MADLIVILILIVVVGSGVRYIVRAKKKGQTCIGCPDCSGCDGHCEEKK